MDEGTPFWQTGFGQLLRWLVFLPIGLFLTVILQGLPPGAVGLARAYKPEFNFLTIIIAIIVVSFLGIFLSLWLACVWMTPFLSCTLIAPNKKVALVIFGTIFCLFQGEFMLSLLSDGTSWIFFTYQLSFSGLLIGGIVLAYKEEENS